MRPLIGSQLVLVDEDTLEYGHTRTRYYVPVGWKLAVYAILLGVIALTWKAVLS